MVVGICVEYGWVRFNGRERFDDGNDGRGPMVQMAMRCLDHVLLLTPCSTHTSRRRAVPPRAPVLASPRVLILACADLLHRWDLEGGHGSLASCFLVSILGRRGRPPSNLLCMKTRILRQRRHTSSCGRCAGVVHGQWRT
jgi:hypothetical protein